MDIYKEMKDNNIPVNSHESDLYAKVTLKSEEIVRDYEHKECVKKFKSNIDGDMWFDIPFAYSPWWDKRIKV